MTFLLMRKGPALMTQMQKATPGGGMTPEQMREWIDEHLKLMNEMMGQMMQEHYMITQGMGMSGMGKKRLPPKTRELRILRESFGK